MLICVINSDYSGIQYIDLFNWEKEVKDLISQIGFVRMIDVQAKTLERYIRDGKIKPDLQVFMSSRTFNYFKVKIVEKYAKEFGWKLINAINMKENM